MKKDTEKNCETQHRIYFIIAHYKCTLFATNFHIITCDSAFPGIIPKIELFITILIKYLKINYHFLNKIKKREKKEER